MSYISNSIGNQQPDTSLIPHIKDSKLDLIYEKFTFPPHSFKFDHIESKQQLQKVLRQLWKVEFTQKSIPIEFPYRILESSAVEAAIRNKNQKITAQCTICTNTLTFSRPLDSIQHIFKAELIYRDHDHSLRQIERKITHDSNLTQEERIQKQIDRLILRYDSRSSGAKRVKFDFSHYDKKSMDEVERCINELPINFSARTRQKVICKVFNLEQSEFKNIYLRLNQKEEMQFGEFVNSLKNRGYDYRFLPENLLEKKKRPNYGRPNPTTGEFRPTTERNNLTHSFIDIEKTNTGTNFQGGINNPQRSDSTLPSMSNKSPNPSQSNMKGNNISGSAHLHHNSGGSSTNQPNPNISQKDLKKIASHLQQPNMRADPHIPDANNPDLPNVMIITSEQMRSKYRRFGQFIGFDLTFSLIREQPSTSKEYLVGVFASKSDSFRITIFALVITNNQSSQTYKWLFKQFFEMMAPQPQSATIITDEQIAIGRAIKQLKQQGLFKGHHLLDTFHVLTKFRKACETETFQLMRKLIHSKDKLQYKYHFEQTIQQLSNDDEVKIMQDFDLHAQKYCYAHIPPTFVGFGVSDALNQSFHNILKDKIPYEIRYLKAVNIMLRFITKRNEMNECSIICQVPLEKTMNFPYLAPYRKLLSDRVFFILMDLCICTIGYNIIFDDNKYEKQGYEKLEEPYDMFGSYGRHTTGENFELQKAMDRDKFQIVTKYGICLVWKEFLPASITEEHSLDNSNEFAHERNTQNGQQSLYNPNIVSNSDYYSKYPQTSTYTNNHYPFSKNQPKLGQTKEYKWRCICQYEEKSGICCSHILKILMLRNQSLLPHYVNPRWLVNQENINSDINFFNRGRTFVPTLKRVDEASLKRKKKIRMRTGQMSDLLSRARKNEEKTKILSLISEKEKKRRTKMKTNFAAKRLQRELETIQKRKNIYNRNERQNLKELRDWMEGNDYDLKQRSGASKSSSKRAQDVNKNQMNLRDAQSDQELEYSQSEENFNAESKRFNYEDSHGVFSEQDSGNEEDSFGNPQQMSRGLSENSESELNDNKRKLFSKGKKTKNIKKNTTTVSTDEQRTKRKYVKKNQTLTNKPEGNSKAKKRQEKPVPIELNEYTDEQVI